MVLTCPKKESGTEVSADPAKLENTVVEDVIVIGLLPVFLILALIPFCLGFAKSQIAGGVGSTSDFGFWYMLQVNIIAVLGSLYSIIPLRKQFTKSVPHVAAAVFWGLGFLAAVASVIMYPWVNVGWSSMASFVGSILTAASVAVLTQRAGSKMGSK
ncbi:hypothetical protein PG996_003178 [Apiospora saccharicola]|uniref:Uncharacterized protein n=1 Tax=Apiospora saccharicola TaxID=335842 RepID=A0ABR1W0J9_9PEZI